ncbi:hypothetical protein JCM19241_3619 [Vibrio ishigakensis]|uniref:G domain-containing protein n=1 Tax=Vibrio ishigakensis TaxID=1481914 RepID=A0A0B8QF74_9VIBR|nr:hypothetical protein JCM19241_3619 [Vibrio ishigakensis]
MTRIRNLFRVLLELSGGRWAIVVISAIFPTLIMVGFGIVLAFKYGYLLEMSILIAVSSLSVSIPLFLLSRVKNKPEQQSPESNLEEIDDDLVKASADWSQRELVIWNESKHLVRAKIDAEVEWNNLDQAALEVLEAVAKRFNKEALEFSIPEGLKLFEEVGRRYKRVITNNIPGIEYLKISYIKAGYEAYEKYGDVGQKILKAAIWANRARQVYTNPIKVAVDVINEQTGSTMTRGVVDDMQTTAKKAFLDEVAAVSIDLYSGRFSIEEESVTQSQVHQQDESRMAAELEPIRIVAVGQTSSGKSSIINELKQELVAEVDVLPSTDSTTVYETVVGEDLVRVVDLQGLDGEPKTEQRMLDEMTQADVILWVLKANQSARELDKKLKQKFDQYYEDEKNISRKQPKVILVVNQVDMLKPIHEWQPPYDLNKPITSKGKIITQAIDYNQKLMEADVCLPLSISPDKEHFGVDTLQQALLESITDASNVQRNRQRLEARMKGKSIKEQVGRAIKVGKKVAPDAIKAAAPHVAGMAAKKIIK